ncbi:hypothetical protein ScPMuIL_002188 [Solemya velum]
MDFLNHIPPEVPDSTILASFDVTSLYTNIPHDLGLTAANFWIEKHRDLVDRRFKTDFLLSALQIVLEGNTFNFDGQTYEQMKGTAMGTKVAPTYANLVMGYLEYKLYEKVKDEFDDDFKQYILGQWKSLLEKGFKFTPTPKPNITEMKSDVQKFCRKLRLREFFGYDTSTDNSLVRNKSNWAPNRGRDSHLDCFIDTITKFPVTNSKNFKQNISKAEQRALEKLKQDETIVIKEADKGGAIVIMDKDYYREKVLDQLNDGIFYKKHSGKKTVMKKIKHLIEHHPNSVTEKEADYLCNFQIKDSNFYGLPKVHKSSEIITAVEEQKCSYIEVHRPKDLKLRPIVAGPESETQRLSHFLDLILKPICEKIPSFVRDDMDFLNHIPPEVPDSTILASFDVTSLYTNIPHDLGLTAANFWIEKHRDLVDRRFKTDFLLSALQIVLEGNTFNFDGQTYEQMKGTAMGTKVAPTYANLVMGYLEYKLYEKVKDEFDDDFKQYILGQWKRMYGTRSNQQDAANTEYGELLREISAKLSELISKFDGLGGAISDITTVSENQKLQSTVKEGSVSKFQESNLCQNVICPRGTRCELKETQCLTKPCPVLAICQGLYNEVKYR